MYLTTTRSDIMYYVSLISRYMENPTEMHLFIAKKFFVTYKEQKIVEFSIRRVKNLICLGLLIVIVQGIEMIERTLRVMSLC